MYSLKPGQSKLRQANEQRHPPAESFGHTPDQISFGGGYWRFNPLLLACLPSTTPTPIPTLVKDTPNLLDGADGLSSVMDFLTSNSDIA